MAQPVTSALRLTWPQICARHPGEWVALVEVDWIDERGLAFTTAVVAGHGRTRRAPLDQIRALRDRYPAVAHLFTGSPRLG